MAGDRIAVVAAALERDAASSAHGWRVVRADDEVYCDFGAYYAVKTRARRVFLPTYLGQLREDERGAVSVLVVHPSALAALRETFPGNWISRGRIETRFSPWEHRLLRATGSESGYWLEVLTKANRS